MPKEYRNEHLAYQKRRCKFEEGEPRHRPCQYRKQQVELHACPCRLTESDTTDASPYEHLRTDGLHTGLQFEDLEFAECI